VSLAWTQTDDKTADSFVAEIEHWSSGLSTLPSIILVAMLYAYVEISKSTAINIV
jgi:hypothetical protein